MKIIKKICPICVLVSGAWLVMLLLRSSGYQVNEYLLSMLMGGSVVGVSGALGKRIKRNEKLWKLFSIPTGFGIMFALINYAWGWFAALVLVYFSLWLIFRKNPAGRPSNRESLSEAVINNELNNCC